MVLGYQINQPVRHATLVYQAGIANVFETSGKPVRLMQSDFSSCEAFVRGIKATGTPVSYAWCNQAGDISEQTWNYESFGDMPFFEDISNDYETR